MLSPHFRPGGPRSPTAACVCTPPRPAEAGRRRPAHRASALRPASLPPRARPPSSAPSCCPRSSPAPPPPQRVHCVSDPRRSAPRRSRSPERRLHSSLDRPSHRLSSPLSQRPPPPWPSRARPSPPAASPLPPRPPPPCVPPALSGCSRLPCQPRPSRLASPPAVRRHERRPPAARPSRPPSVRLQLRPPPQPHRPPRLPPRPSLASPATPQRSRPQPHRPARLSTLLRPPPAGCRACPSASCSAAAAAAARALTARTAASATFLACNLAKTGRPFHHRHHPARGQSPRANHCLRAPHRSLKPAHSPASTLAYRRSAWSARSSLRAARTPTRIPLRHHSRPARPSRVSQPARPPASSTPTNSTRGADPRHPPPHENKKLGGPMGTPADPARRPPICGHASCASAAREEPSASAAPPSPRPASTWTIPPRAPFSPPRRAVPRPPGTRVRRAPPPPAPPSATCAPSPVPPAATSVSPAALGLSLIHI
eukprot:5628470-Prymnesium_polylepis.2